MVVVVAVNGTENVKGDAAAAETGSAGIEAAKMTVSVVSGAVIGRTGSGLIESVPIENGPIGNGLTESGQNGTEGTVTVGTATAEIVATDPTVPMMAAKCLQSARSAVGAEVGSENASGAAAVAASTDAAGSATAPSGVSTASSRSRLVAISCSNSSHKTALWKTADRLVGWEVTTSQPTLRAMAAVLMGEVATTVKANRHSRWRGPRSTTRLRHTSGMDKFCLRMHSESPWETGFWEGACMLPAHMLLLSISLHHKLWFS